MSQRDSGYERKERDCYETPEWVTLALAPHLPEGQWCIWEPACGSGKMQRALEKSGYSVIGTDIDEGDDFLLTKEMPGAAWAIVTNPPYAIADEFIDHAITLMNHKCQHGFVAMLLRTDFDHAKMRKRLFADSPVFAKKLVLTRRIKWFEDSAGSPSFNHAWFIWDWNNKNSPTLAYD